MFFESFTRLLFHLSKLFNLPLQILFLLHSILMFLLKLKQSFNTRYLTNFSLQCLNLSSVFSRFAICFDQLDFFHFYVVIVVFSHWTAAGGYTFVVWSGSSAIWGTTSLIAFNLNWVSQLVSLFLVPNFNCSLDQIVKIMQLLLKFLVDYAQLLNLLVFFFILVVV